MYVHSMKELHNKYVIMTNYHYFNHEIIKKTRHNNYTDKIPQLQKELPLDYKDYGKSVVPNIRNRTTNINTIKPHKRTKKRRNQIWHAVIEKLYKDRI